jgi:hypothetical protein
MSHYLLTVPEDIYARARRVAEETSQMADQVMIDYQGAKTTDTTNAYALFPSRPKPMCPEPMSK